MLFVEVDEVGAMYVVSGPSGYLWNPVCPWNNLEPEAKGSAASTLSFLCQPLAQVLRMFYAGTSLAIDISGSSVR